MDTCSHTRGAMCKRHNALIHRWLICDTEWYTLWDNAGAPTSNMWWPVCYEITSIKRMIHRGPHVELGRKGNRLTRVIHKRLDRARRVCPRATANHCTRTVRHNRTELLETMDNKLANLFQSNVIKVYVIIKHLIRYGPFIHPIYILR